MPRRVALHHVTQYQYDRQVELGPQIVRLRPASHYRGRVLSYALRVEPDGHFLHWQQDVSGNHQAQLSFLQKTDLFRVVVDLEIERESFNPFDFILDASAEQMPLTYSPSLRHTLAPCLQTDSAGPLMQQYLQTIDHHRIGTIDFLVRLNQRLQQDIRYLVRREPGVQTPEETLHKRSGSCRDSGWLLTQLLRQCGLAARFVSGYLIPLLHEAALSGEPVSETAANRTDLHAWCEVYLPGAGWIGLDPTSGLLASEDHVPLACTPDPSGAAPVEGRVGKCEVNFSHHLSVTCHDD